VFPCVVQYRSAAVHLPGSVLQVTLIKRPDASESTKRCLRRHFFRDSPRRLSCNSQLATRILTMADLALPHADLAVSKAQLAATSRSVFGARATRFDIDSPEEFRDFTQSLQANVGFVPGLPPLPLPSKSFPIHHSTVKCEVSVRLPT
jgi:hypothetical protein